MNWELLKAIREEGLTQRDFSRLVGENESIISRIVNGIWNADEERKRKYAAALKRNPEDIFVS